MAIRETPDILGLEFWTPSLKLLVVDKQPAPGGGEANGMSTIDDN
jgi:hypothetical protein